MEWFIPALLGFIGGVIGSLIAPWVHWAIEKRRSLLEYRRNQVKEWRSQVEDHNWNEGSSFGNNTAYATIRPLMKEKIVKDLERPRTFIMPGGRGDNPRKQIILDEIARIEKEWDLI